MNKSNISYLAVYPPIGIARIGNSPEYFIASDVPGVAPQPENGYKDSEGRVKKQVARFRIYAFDAQDNPIAEITNSDDCKITWNVHVANIKAGWYQFNNALDLPGLGVPAAPRNPKVKGADRAKLIIKPQPKTIEGEGVQGDEYRFDDGKFYDKNVCLGEIRTDEKGRLLFFGGDGDSESNTKDPATTFANNVGWHDDTCDGIVRASIRLDGQDYEAVPAVVAVTPPNFGPGLFGVVTMNDVVQNTFIKEMGYPDPAADGVIFQRDIYPVLERMVQTQWVNHGFFVLFGHNSPADFTAPDMLKQLADPSPASEQLRQRVFSWFRNPSSNEAAPVQIPPFYGDGFGEYVGIAAVDLPITVVQYERLEKWANGEFSNEEYNKPTDFDAMSLAEQIESLNQAPLEECLGGPFHPGIELTWPLRVKSMWAKPYRLNVVAPGEDTALDYGPLLAPAIVLSTAGPLTETGPGALTCWLGVPWQTDEASCLSGYDTSTYLPLPSFWAARVPNQVLSAQSFGRMNAPNVPLAQRLKHFDYRQDWLRDFGSDYLKKINKMIHEWHELGIITQTNEEINPDEMGFLPKTAWVESGRHFSGDDPTMEQVILAENIEQEPMVAAKGVPAPTAAQPQRIRPRRTFGRDER